MIKQFKPYIGNDEYQKIKECFDINWITEGPLTQELGDRLCKSMDVKYGVFAPNGTLAIYLGLKALGITTGDEVIVPNFTFIATANAVQMTGATPIFVDILPNLHIDINECKKVLTSKTKAIMPVHIYGMACNMTEVVAFAKEHNLNLIEDAAQGIGVTWNGQHSGTFGDIGCFSFFADKTITMGEGGFVTTNNNELYENLLYLRNQGRKNRGSFIHPRIGYNFRITDIQSAIALIQFEKLPYIIQRKLTILDTYKKYLDVSIPIIEPCKESNHIPFRVCILFPSGAERVMEYMTKHGIETRSFFYPLSNQPCYANHNQTNKFEVSEEMYRQGVCLPSYVELTEEEIKYTCEKINEYIR